MKSFFNKLVADLILNKPKRNKSKKWKIIFLFLEESRR